MKKFTALVLMLAMLLCLIPTGAMAAEKIITVDSQATSEQAGSCYTTIQGAIDYINTIAEKERTGWTIKIQSGTYERFYVPDRCADLVITAAEQAKVVIDVLDGKSIEGFPGGGICNDQCCLIMGSDITISGLTFDYSKCENHDREWYEAAITVYTDKNITVENCVFNGIDNIGYGIFAQNGVCSLTVTGCTFTDLEQGIWGENSGGWFVATKIENNTFNNCSFAIHWAYNAGKIIVDGNISEEEKRIMNIVTIT